MPTDIFQNAACPIIGETYVDLGRDLFVVGKIQIPVDRDEANMISVLMSAALDVQNNHSFNFNDLRIRCGLPTDSICRQVFERLIEKLDKYPVANYGGNGSFYEDTVLASDLIRINQDGIYFYSALSCEIAKSNYPSDEAFESIDYFPRNYKTMACCQ